MAERFESVNLGTVKRDWLRQPHALSATTASSEPPNGPPKSCFSCGALDHFKKYCPKNLKTKGTKPSTQEKTPAVCKNFNRFKKAPCERANNTCSQGRVHKCSVCHKLACKPLRHSQVQVNQVGVSDPVKALTEQVQSLASRLNSIDSAQSETEKASTSPDATQSSTSTSVPVFGLPAVSDVSSQLQNCLNLSQKNILWCKVESGGIPIPLPIDSCCSVSLVSQAHAMNVSKNCPNLNYEALANPIPVSVASPQVMLQAVGIIPIHSGPGAESVFKMLVVPNLTLPILFGESHLHQTDALVDDGKKQVHFCHPNMNFIVQCRNDNPANSFPFPSNNSTNSGSA